MTRVDGSDRIASAEAIQGLRVSDRPTFARGNVSRLCPTRAPDQRTICSSESRRFPRTSILWMSKSAEETTTHAAMPRASTAAIADTDRGTRGLSFTEPPHEVDLGFQFRPEPFSNSFLNHPDQGVHVLGGSPLGGHNEIGMLLRNLGSPHDEPFGAGGLDEPGRVISGRVLEDAAAVWFGQRLGRSPPFACLIHVLADVRGMARPQTDPGRRHHSPVRERRSSVSESRLSRADPMLPPLAEDEDLDPFDHFIQRMSVRSGVHPNAASQRRRDGHSELQSGKRVGESHAGQSRQRHGRTGGQPVAVSGHPPEGPAQSDDQPLESLVRDQKVGTLSDHQVRDARFADGPAHGSQVRVGLHLEVQGCRAPEPERSQPGERVVLPQARLGRLPEDPLGYGQRSVTDHGARRRASEAGALAVRAPSRRASVSSPTMVMSPAPSVRTRSPERTSRARNGATSDRRGRYTARFDGAASRRASTTSLPVIPGTGSSPAPYTSVTTTRSALERLSPNCRDRAAVLEYRCGWNTATSRTFPSVRAAASVAATSTGWWA